MTQYAYPNADIENPGAWTTEPLWKKMDEEPFDDDDFVTSPKSATDKSFTLGLSGVTDPEVHTDHIVRIRAYAKVTGTVKYELMQGAVVIKDSGEIALTTGFAEYNMTLSEAEAANITDYAALRVRATAVTTQKNQYQYVSWIRFECPDAAAQEFVYSGDVPLNAIPDTPKASLSKSYGGNIPLSALSGYSSILEMLYSGDVSLAILPDAPLAPMEKSYDGAVGFALVPNSAYELAVEYVYAGDIPLVALPDFPKAALEKSYTGDIGLVLTPNSIYELISGAGEFVYAGDIPLMALPSHALVMDRVYQGAVALDILPVFPKALLEKAYDGVIALALTMNSAYLLGQPAMEFLYTGNIPISLLPDYLSALEKAYSGDVGAALTGFQISGEERRGLLLIGNPNGITFIGRKKPVLISEK